MNDRPHPSRRELGLIAAVLAYMAIQITVPLTHMPFRYETAFAWKMYSYQRSAPFELRLIMANGRAVGWRDVPNRGELAKILRPEVNRSRFLPPYVCRRFSDVRAVESRTGEGQAWRRLECR